MNNDNLIIVSRHMQRMLQELHKADVTVLSARIDMIYNTPRPHPFRYRIHVWYDENFMEWANQYQIDVYEQIHETAVKFLAGKVFALDD